MTWGWKKNLQNNLQSVVILSIYPHTPRKGACNRMSWKLTTRYANTYFLRQSVSKSPQQFLNTFSTTAAKKHFRWPRSLIRNVLLSENETWKCPLGIGTVHHLLNERRNARILGNPHFIIHIDPAMVRGLAPRGNVVMLSILTSTCCQSSFCYCNVLGKETGTYLIV